MDPAPRKHPEIEPDVRPNLRVIEGGGESTPRQGNLQAADSATAKDLDSQERRFGVIQGGGETTADRGNLHSVSSNINSTRENEQAGGGFTNNFTGGAKPQRGATLKNMMKKKGPLGVVAALLLGGGAGLGFFGLTLMPITIMEQFTNDLNDLNASQQRKTINLFGNRIGGDQKKKDEACKNASSARCKSFSFTEELIEIAEKEGFSFGDKKVENGRVTVGSMKFPDNGPTVNNRAEFENLMRNNNTAIRALNLLHNTRSGIFTMGDFFEKRLNKMGFTLRKKIEGKTKEEAKKSYEESTRGEKGRFSLASIADKNTNDEEKQKSADGDELAKIINEKVAAGEKLKTLPVGRLGTGIAGVGRMACTAYNMAGLIAATAKVKKALRFAGFAMIFLTLASSIKANDATEAEVGQAMSVLAPSTYPEQIKNPQTGDMMDNPDIGLNALDAEAYKVVAYGDQINLTELALQFFIASGALGVLEKVLKWMDDTFTKQGVKTTCQLLNNPIIGVLSFLAAPAFAAVILGLTEILPIEKIAAEIVNLAIDAVAGVDLTNDVIGKPAGEVLFIGAGVALGGASQGFGLPPGNFDEIRENVRANHEILEREIAMEKEEAAKTPFDIKNRYSFLGSLSSKLANFTPSALSPNSGVTNAVGKVLSAFPVSLGMISKNAKAEFTMPVADYSNVRFDQCKDEAYKAIGMSPDMFCVVRYAPFEHVDMDAALTYMEENGMITPEGEPVPGKYLDKFKRHCTDREDPWGSTSVPIEEQTDKPIEWYTGKMCMDNTVENQMASEYTGYRIVQQTVDREVTNSQSTTTTPISGDARALALQAANNPNIIWREVTKAQLVAFSKGDTVIDGCSAPMTVSKYLLGALLTNAKKYRITVNNIGFKQDRDRCELGNYQHPKGTAVDIVGIDALDGSGSSRGTIELPADAAIVNRYATDFLAALPRNRGGVGQSDHGVNPTFPPGSVALNGSHLFPDSPDHLHIDARNRENLSDTE